MYAASYRELQAYMFRVLKYTTALIIDKFLLDPQITFKFW